MQRFAGAERQWDVAAEADELAVGDVFATHLVLNCQPASWLAGGASVTFAMRLPIPADAPAGTATLVWFLGERGADVKATFQVGP